METGETVDVRSGDEAFDNPGRGTAWGPERTVRSELLYELLVGYPGACRAIVLQGTRISGALNLEAVSLVGPRILDGCFCDGPINLREAKAPVIRLNGCRLTCLAADQLETRGDLDLSHSTAAIISLRGAHVGGELILYRTTLTGDRWPLSLDGVTLRPPVERSSDEDQRDHMALVADGLMVDGDMRMDHPCR